MGAKTSYQATLRELGQRASGAIEEIYADLSNLNSRIRFLDSSNRNALAKQVEGLYDVCKMSGVTVWHNSECVQGLNLSMMSPWTRNFRNERGIEKAIAIINKTRYSEREVVDLLKDASKWGIDSAAGRDPKKRVFLEAVAQGSISSRFLEDVAEEYQNQSSRQSYEGKCGHTVGSRSYMEYMETQVFGTLVSGFGNPDYARFLRDALRSVAAQLERDLDNAIRENDYITDQTAANLKAVVGELDHCGVSTGSLNSKIEKLAWFMGGDPSKIRKLQKTLNELGCSDHLKEDGVVGQKTLHAWEQFIRELEHGVVPALAWTDLLQTEHTGIKIDSSTNGGKAGLTNAFKIGEHPYIRFDPPHGGGKTMVRGVKKTIDYNHINIDKVANSNWLYDQIQKNFDHYPLSDKAYKLATHLDSTTKEIRVAGKKLLASGLVLDALELGSAIVADIKDSGKMPDKTISSAVSIGGSWAGAALLTKAGVALGIATGLAAPFAIPILAIAGGILGSVGGSRLADYLIDITKMEE